MREIGRDTYTTLRAACRPFPFRSAPPLTIVMSSRGSSQRDHETLPKI